VSEANNSANRCRRSISYLSGARPQPLLLLLLLLLVVVVFAMMMMETIVWNDGRVGVDVDTVPCVEQRGSGRGRGVEELLRSADSCCCRSRLGM